MSVASQSDLNILNYIAKRPSADHLTVLLLSSNINYARNLRDCLNKTFYTSGREWKLIVHCSLNVDDLIQREESFGPVSIDYVVVVLDLDKIFCLEWARKMIIQCHPDLRLGRMVLVNPSILPITSMQVPFTEVIDFKNEYNLRMLNANLTDEKDCLRLSKRILILLENSSGINTGIPNLIL